MWVCHAVSRWLGVGVSFCFVLLSLLAPFLPPRLSLRVRIFTLWTMVFWWTLVGLLVVYHFLIRYPLQPFTPAILWTLPDVSSLLISIMGLALLGLCLCQTKSAVLTWVDRVGQEAWNRWREEDKVCDDYAELPAYYLVFASSCITWGRVFRRQWQ